MGETFYKLACLYALNLVRKQIREALGPLQFAFSPGGPESALHILQSAIEVHPDWVIISTDISNAFNTRSRPDILTSLFNVPSLSPLFRLAHWSYGFDSTLLLMNNGKIQADFLSCEGVRQGDVLGSLLFSLSMRHTYSTTIEDTDCHAVAVVDDFYILGPAQQAFTCFDKFRHALPNLLLNLNLPKCCTLLPDDPPEALLQLCTDRHLPYFTESIPALGSIVSRDPNIISAWLIDQIKEHHGPFFKALLDSRLPTQHAFILLRTCMVPRMNYWTRTTSPSTLAPAAQLFDQMVQDTFLQRINLTAVSDAARVQLSLPVRDGGFGLSSVVQVSPAAWYSGFARAFSTIRTFAPPVDDVKNDIPFVKSLTQCFTYFSRYKFPKGVPVATDIKRFWNDFENASCPTGTQRLMMAVINRARFQALLQEYPRNSIARARLTAVTAPFSGSWLTSPPIDRLFYLSDIHFALASRIRLGVILFDDVKRCVCGASVTESPLHFLACKRLNASRIIRHDRLVQALSRVARLCGVTVHLEPRIDGEDRSRGDGHLFFHAQSAIFDTLVIDPCAKSYVNISQRLLGAATAGEAKKDALYQDRCRRQDFLFFPVVMEVFGGMGIRGRDLIDKIQEEGKLNGVPHLHGLKIKTFLSRALAFCLQHSNAHLAIYGSKRSRQRLQ